MKVSEFRIGNLVNQIIYHSFYNEEKVIEIEWQELMLISRDNSNKYHPIPLTEEWLVKFGLTRSETDNKRFFMCGVDIYFFSTDKIIFNPSSSVLSISLKHVHQLQNLYFALTGIELTFKSE